jgi:hypothetical protein
MTRRKGLGRLRAPDPRDMAFPLRALIPRRVPIRSRYYRTGPVLDQGSTPQCVAFAWKQWLDSAPVMDPNGRPPAPATIYSRAQAVDEWAGSPHDGTSVRAGAKIMATDQRLGAYHWSASINDVRDYLMASGTVVLGTNWYEEMFDPSANGFVKIGGELAGGHAYLCIGYSVDRGAFRMINSWGSRWGQGGRFWIAGEDLARLLNEDGEACAGLEVKA